MKKRILTLGLASCLFLASCGTKKLIIQSCSPIYAMDTTISITFYNVADYEKHYQEIKKEYQKISEVSNDFEETSCPSVYELNQKRTMEVNDDLLDLLKQAEKLRIDTNGYFNPYIGKLSHAWKNAMEEEKMLEDSYVKQEVESMNQTSLVFQGNQVTIVGDGNIDLGAIAKGYATEKVKEYLTKEGITSYYIDAGNSTIVLGDKAEDFFTVGLTKPFSNGYVGKLKLMDKVLSTSSPKYQKKEIEGQRIHHILNPFSGYPSNTYDSVFILGDNSFYGDAYSTAVFSMDIDTAVQFSKENRIDIILYKEDRVLYSSEEVQLL